MLIVKFSIIVLLFQCADSENQKRLVLHSGDDVALEFQKLRLEIQTLNSKIATLEKEQGSTYVRWGKTTCDGNGTDKVYSGFTAGSPYDVDGGAASYVCLPQHPTWAKYLDGIQNIGGYISTTSMRTHLVHFHKICRTKMHLVYSVAVQDQPQL